MVRTRYTSSDGGGDVRTRTAIKMQKIGLPVNDEVAQSILKRVTDVGGVQQLWEKLGDEGTYSLCFLKRFFAFFVLFSSVSGKMDKCVSACYFFFDHSAIRVMT